MKLIPTGISFLHDLYENKFVIFQLTKRDYANRYLGSFLGFIWTLIQPVVMVLIFYFVFVIGFKTGDIRDGVPFIAYLTIGMLVWNLYSEGVTNTTNVFQEYSYLVKKINFRIAVLPIVKILSALMTHFIFIGITVVVLVIVGVPFSWWWLQIFYYLFAMMLFLLGTGWIIASLQVFVKDIAQIVSVLLQFGFWLTPIVWNFDLLPEKWQFILKFNPAFYLVEGYRKSFIYHEAFWVYWQSGAYFWGITFIILVLGVLLFRKLRPHFADVL
ncbi:teichoic acid ABC transporter permease [Candidatus Peregrinibacteria bacterium CG_4_10_14_0_2_um_filter_43_11]|nr:MAG: teichoic acid ABC transporter permease [Candidatus Peregrinibacteria bacterium CG_4_10_14_0_2_um_filter_43_11]